MGLERIILSQKAENDLNNLAEVLFYQNYFGFKKDAKAYVQKIRDYIEIIPNGHIKLCSNNKFGKYYVRYDNPKSKMKYYITFIKLDDNYLIKKIISPKTIEYQLMMGK